MAKIRTICITGGPCGGKSTFISELMKKERFCGYRVLLVPESATLLSTTGMSYDDGEYMWQYAIMDTQLALENTAKRYAEELLDDVLIICDRGVLDGYAYMSSDDFEDIIFRHDETPSSILRRYDAIIHLVSAADGAEDAYTCDNNEARRESLEEAKDIEKRTRRAWEGKHPTYRVIPNDGDFDTKRKNFFNTLEELLD